MTERTPDPEVISDEVVLPPPPTEVPQGVPGDKPDEPEPQEATEQAETTEEAEEEPEQPKKSSGYARLKARHQAVIAENEHLRRLQQATLEAVKPPAEPKVEDFNGDYLAFEKASVAFSAERAVEKALAKAASQEIERRKAEQNQETLQDFFERTEEIKAKIPDFDKAIDNLHGQIGALNPTLRDMIAKSDKGPLILYQLAKNPGFARDLQSYGPLDQAQEIGKLEERLSMPRKETSAPPPIRSPKGGAAPPRDIFGLAGKSDDISDYVKARKAMKD